MPVDPSEMLTRYIFDDNVLRKDNSVQKKVFVPRNKEPKEVSVFRTSGLTESGIWRIGTVVGKKSGRLLKGRADIRTSDVLKTGLSVAESKPPSKHASIIGWPDNKSGILRLAKNLSELATGFRFDVNDQ